MPAPKPFVIGVTAVASTAIVAVLTTSAPADAQHPRPSTPVDIVSSVPLNVSGDIGLVPGGSVNIGNAPDSPVPVVVVGEAAKEPFQKGTVATAFSSSSSSSEIITVPAGKRLVLEHVSAWINATGPDGVSSVNIGIQGGAAFDTVPCQQSGQTANGLNHFFACSSQTKFYAEAGQTVQFFVSVTNNAGGFYRAFMSGYYEPVP